MSDHWIAVIPRDPRFVPDNTHVQRALDYFKSIAPESDEVTFSIDSHIKFRDCGENLETIHCPHCGAQMDHDWWSDAMSNDHDGNGFHLAPIDLPCCDAKADLSQMIYSFDQGFSRFIMEAMNPSIGELGPAQIQRLTALLGTELKIIYQHL